MKKEEKLTEILNKFNENNGISKYDLIIRLKEVWNLAIQEASDNAQSFIGTDNHGQDIPIVSKGSITNLKF